MSNDVLSGTLKIHVPEQKLSPAGSRAMRRMYGDGVDVPASLRFNCAIAMATNAAIHNADIEYIGRGERKGECRLEKHDCAERGCGINVDGKLYPPNRKAPCQFGRNGRHIAYLTFGLIDTDTNEPITVQTLGDDLPALMFRVSVSHDMGQNTDPVTIPLKLENALVYVTGAKTDRAKHKRDIDKRSRHDIAKNGRVREREPRHHDRVCAEDLRERGIR